MITSAAIWKTLVSIFGAGCTSALLTFFLNINVQRQHEKRQISTAAVLVASDLENYAEQCSDVVDDYDDVTIRNRGGLAKHLPLLPNFQDHEHWEGLPGDQVSEVLALRLKIRVAESYIKSAVRFAGPADVTQATRDEAVLIGADAWLLARDLRETQMSGRLQKAVPLGDELVRSSVALRRLWKSGLAMGVDPDAG